MKKLIFLFLFCSLPIFGQESNNAQFKLDSLLKLSRITDSIIKDSRQKHYDFTHISERISEGSITMIDTINGKQIKIGKGGFGRYTFTDRNVDQIIKSRHDRSIYYNEKATDSLKGKFIRLEIDIYYIKEKPVFAKYFTKSKRDDKILDYTNFYVQLNTDNLSQKDIKDYILELSKDVIANKK